MGKVCSDGIVTSCLVVAHLEEKSLRKQTYSLASSIWSGDDILASGCGCTLRNRDSSPTFLKGRCFNIKLFSSLKRLTSSFSFYGLGHG